MKRGTARLNRVLAPLLPPLSFLCFTSLAIAQVQPATIDTYAGGGNGDGEAGINATINPRGLALSGNLNAPDIFVADATNNRVRRIDGDTGLITTAAGNGVAGFSGDGSQAQNASLNLPFDVAVDGAGNAYIADTLNSRIRKVGTDGRISTFAGNGNQTFSGDGIATQVAVNQPYGIGVGPDGNVYIADSSNNRVRKVSPPGCTPSTCVISTVAGTGTPGFAGDDGPATRATLRNPTGVAIDGRGIIYIADSGNGRIRRVGLDGTITTVAGGGTSLADGVPGTQAKLSSPGKVAVDNNGNVYIADTGNLRIRMVQVNSFTISTVAGTGSAGDSGDGGPPTQAQIYSPYGVAASTPGNFWFSQSNGAQPISNNNRVRMVINSSVIRAAIGGGLGDGEAPTDAFVDPQGGEAVAAGGVLPDLYFADGSNNVVRRIDGNTGIIHVVGGTGATGYSGDGGPARNATMNLPTDVAVDPTDGDLYVADSLNNVIRKISANGTITTAAGTGEWGFNGDQSASRATLAQPNGVDVDSAGNVYIADMLNYRVRKIVGGQLITVAGNGASGYAGDGGSATAASLKSPSDVAVGSDGTLYIADGLGNRIRSVSPAGIISTFAGIGQPGFAGDLGPAINAKIYSPTYLAFDAAGNLYESESRNNRVRRIDASAAHIIQTVAGNGQSGFSGDGGAATSASFSSPTGVAVDPAGAVLFISVSTDHRMRVVNFISGPLPSTPTFTATPIPPTATFTATPIPPTPTAIPPTSTAIPPTPTSRPTSTSVPTSTRTPTQPATPIATSTSVPTSTRTPTQAAASTATSTSVPTSTRTPTQAATPTATNTAGSSMLSVSGQITYYANSQVNVPGVAVNLNGLSNQTVATDSTGNYTANIASGSTVEILPSKAGNFGVGVSSLDASFVLQAVAGLITFTPLQRLACDVTGDGSLSALDAQRILQFSAGLINHFPVALQCGSDWVFSPSPDLLQNQQVVPPMIGGGTCQPGKIVLSPLLGAAANQDFDAILFGDCTGNWTPTTGALQQVAPAGTTVQTGAPRHAPDNQLLIPVYVHAHSPFTALDLQVSYDSSVLTLTSVVPRGSAAGAMTGISNEQPGLIGVSLASALPIDPSLGVMLILEFHSTGPIGTNPVRLVQAQVDEQTTAVATHSAL